ncbi:hypothetical protein V3C99_017368 [Haemonchus contortus]
MNIVFVLLKLYWLLVRTVAQPPVPPPERPGTGVTCTPNNPYTCTGRNPFCAATSGNTFKCCSDRIQDSAEIDKLDEEHVKPVCPGGAIPYGIPQVMLCDPVIVNICPNSYTVRLNVHTSATMHAPEIRTGDHFVLAPFRLLEPAYLKGVKLFAEQTRGSYIHVLLFDPLSSTETMQLYYDRVPEGDRYVDLEKPIEDGGFISKRIFNAPPQTNIENPKRPGPIKEC